MRKFLSFFAIVLSFHAWSADTDKKLLLLNMQLRMDLQNSSPEILTRLGGAPSTIVQVDERTKEGYELKIRSGEVPEGSAIKLDFILSRISADGRRELISKPQIIVLPDQTAKLSHADDSSGKNFELSVTPKFL